jgi:hypothetical protein
MTTKYERALAEIRNRAAIEHLRAEAISLQGYLVERLGAVVRSAQGTPTLNFRVKNFYAVDETSGGKPKIVYDLKLSGGGDRASQRAPNDPTIFVSLGGAVSFEVTVTAAGGAIDLYYPIGIAFAAGNKARIKKRDVDVHDNFAQTYVDGTSLFFTDYYLPTTYEASFKFSVIIQRASDGKVGVIDPGIVHTPAPKLSQ